MKIAIITGASSGIGKEFARQMDRYFTNIDEFWLVARREDKLEELSKHLLHKTLIFPLDITQDYNLDELEYEVIRHSAQVCMLINCAGYGLMGHFVNQNREEALGMIRLNCEALSNVTHRLIRYMHKGSRIIQLASSAAFVPQTDFAVYAATKSYVLSFSRALNRELSEKGITVTAVCPGPVDTPFFDIAEKTGSSLAIKKYTMVSPVAVVKQALKDSYKKKSVSVCSIPIKLFRVFAKLVPHDIILSIMRLLKSK